LTGKNGSVQNNSPNQYDQQVFIRDGRSSFPVMDFLLVSILLSLLTTFLNASPVESEVGDSLVSRSIFCQLGSSRCIEDGYQICRFGMWGSISHCSSGSACVNNGIAYCSTHCSRESPKYPSYCDPKLAGYWYCPDPNGSLWKWIGCTKPKTFCNGFGVRGAGVTCMSAPL
jgi:hypothetical protein